MPPAFVALHLVSGSAAFWLVRRARPGSRCLPICSTAVIGLALGGLLLDWNPAWSWRLMGVGWPDLVFVSPPTLLAAGVIAGLLWRAAGNKSARRRAVALSAALLTAAGASYAWYFMPQSKAADRGPGPDGYCPQTTEETCSAAAAAMLLGAHGIRVTENEMAALCLTRPRQGTRPLGLYRGVARKAESRGLRASAVRVQGVRQLASMTPAIIAVGIRPGCPPGIRARMEGFGWRGDRQHAVMVRTADPAGRWLQVFDPSYGPEKWPARDIEWIWDGYALVLTR